MVIFISFPSLFYCKLFAYKGRGGEGEGSKLFAYKGRGGEGEGSKLFACKGRGGEGEGSKLFARINFRSVLTSLVLGLREF